LIDDTIFLIKTSVVEAKEMILKVCIIKQGEFAKVGTPWLKSGDPKVVTVPKR
jgi:hypothetical protein